MNTSDLRLTNVNNDWKSLKEFFAKSSAKEKANSLGNDLIVGLAIYSFFTASTGPLGPISYALVARKLSSIGIGYLAFPAARTSFSKSERHCLKNEENNNVKLLGDDYYTQKISLYKMQTKFDALLVGHTSTIHNGKWTIHALGNGGKMEAFIHNFAQKNFKNKSNTLLINGPSVCESGGWPTSYQMGAGFEAGLQFLEKEVKASHIIMHGISFGGGMMSEAISSHDFTKGMKKRKIQYLSISDRTFSHLSTLAGSLYGRIVEPIFFASGMELDCVSAAKKLSDLGIRHIILQHTSQDASGTDRTIPDGASLAHELHKDKAMPNRVFLESEEMGHDLDFPEEIKKKLDGEIQQFLGND